MIAPEQVMLFSNVRSRVPDCLMRRTILRRSGEQRERIRAGASMMRCCCARAVEGGYHLHLDINTFSSWLRCGWPCSYILAYDQSVGHGVVSAAVAFSAPVPDNPLNTLATRLAFDPAARRAELLAQASLCGMFVLSRVDASVFMSGKAILTPRSGMVAAYVAVFGESPASVSRSHLRFKALSRYLIR